MTDEELCKDARSAAKCLKDTGTFPTGQGIFLDCADRIEALTKRLTAMGEQADKDMAFIGDYIIANGNLLAERDSLEAKLAKAVELLKEARQDIEEYVTHEWPKDEHPVYERKWERDMELCRRIDTTLAEIEGEKTW
jgi:hypothetical protein